MKKRSKKCKITIHHEEAYRNKVSLLGTHINKFERVIVKLTSIRTVLKTTFGKLETRWSSRGLFCADILS